MIVPNHPVPIFKGGGGINIKPSHRGRFTAWAKSHNMSVQEAASHVMANKGQYDSSVVKMANFAKNFGGSKAEGGKLPELGSGGQMNFKSGAAYHKWLGYVHATGLAESTPGSQAVSIQGQPHKVIHSAGGTMKRYAGGGGLPGNLLPGESGVFEGNLPGLDFAGGGGATSTPARKVTKDEVDAYTQQRINNLGPNNQLLADVQEGDPYFSDQNAFNSFYQQRAITKLSPEDLSHYNQILSAGDKQGAQAFIALKGGTPLFQHYSAAYKAKPAAKTTPTQTPTTRLPKFKIKPTQGGYRYGAKGGQGLPAKGSITKHSFGGTLGERILQAINQF